MPYRITIQDYETKKPIAGSVYLYDGSGAEIGLSGIPVGGADLTDNPVFDLATHIQVNAPGYSSFGTDIDQLYSDVTYVRLVKKSNPVFPYVIGGLAVYIGMNLFKKMKFF